MAGPGRAFLRRAGGRLGCFGGLGGEAPRGSRSQGGPRRRGPAAIGRPLQRARAPLRARVQGSRPRGHPQDAAQAEGLLRLHGVQLRLVLQRHRGALHHARGQALQLAGPAADHRRADQRLGAAELPAERPRLQGRFLRRLWRGLAARVRRPRPLLRHRRRVRRHHRDCGRGLRAPRRQVPPADGPHLRRDPLPEQGEEQAREDGDARAGSQPHEAHQRPPGVPLLRPLRARLRDPLLLQLGFHDRGRRPEDGELHPHPQCHGPQGVDRPGHQPRERPPLRRPRDPRAPGGLRPRRRPLRPGPRVGPHPLQLQEPPEPRRTRQLQRRARTLPHGPSLGGRRSRRRVPGAGRQAHDERADATQRDLRGPLPQHPEGAVRQVPPRLRLPGGWPDDASTGAPRASGRPSRRPSPTP